MKHIASIPLLAAMLAFGGCAQYATVSETKPHFRPLQHLVGKLLPVEEDIARAALEEKRQPLSAIRLLLTVAETAQRQLKRNPDDADARNAYNFAVARVFSTLRYAKLDPWSQPLHVPSDGGEFVLTHRPDPRPQWNPALYEFIPTDQFVVSGTYVTRKVVKEGVGAPLVVIGKDANKDARETFAVARTYYGVTAIIRFEGRRAVISLEDPLATERIALDGHSFPLAADFTVPLAVMLASTNPKKLELMRLLRPEQYAETARISRLQPYDPNKTVVLVVHGLMDSPATWAPMINQLRANEDIRRNYQFWFYSYPSGYPYPYSASIMRRELDAIERRYPMRRKMVLIGHSMGGCISRLMITDTGDKLWLELFKKPPGEVSLSADSREFLTEALIFRHRSEVGRVIFVAAPLRGSQMASGWAGRLGSMLVRTPKKLLRVGTDAFKITTFQGDDLKLKRIPNSVDTLAPNNRFVKAIQTLPLTPGIPYNVISGDRGKGGNKDRTKPQMSDGIVPYWSSHMEGAESELVVHSSHSAHQNQQAMDEVERILKLHAGR
jgi:pimeloyl-ACP methyl ester carboxylesterase